MYPALSTAEPWENHALPARPYSSRRWPWAAPSRRNGLDTTRYALLSVDILCLY